MKNLRLLICVIFAGLVACNNPTSNYNAMTNNLPDTVGYYTAKDMKGLTYFKIGESTYYNTLKKIKEEIRKESKKFKETNYKEIPRYNGYQEKYMDFKYDSNGNIISEYYREDFGSIFKEVKYDTIESYIKQDFLEKEIFGCPKIREIRMYTFYIGDIEIRSLELKFYKDTLYQISCSQNDKIEEGFKSKYGNGKSTNNSVERVGKISKIDKIIIWENETIKAESKTYIEYKYDGERDKGAGYSNCVFNMNSKNERILRELNDCENLANESKKRIEKRKKEKEINQL